MSRFDALWVLNILPLLLSPIQDTGPSKELESCQAQVSELKERLRQLRYDYDQLENVLHEKEESFGKTIVSLQEKHRVELDCQAGDHKQKLGELESEIRRHRERTIAMLAEKDRELDSLRAKSPDNAESRYTMNTLRQMSPPAEQPIAREIGASSEEESAVSELISRSTMFPGSAGETALLHFAQEQARREVEIQNLRKQKHSLEMALRDLQHSSSMKQQQAADTIDSLKEEIRKHERDKSRESANLEYLKNVVYHFMVTQDKLGKQQTLNAISTILQFSPREKDQVETELNKGWWKYPAGPHGQQPGGQHSYRTSYPNTRIWSSRG